MRRPRIHRFLLKQHPPCRAWNGLKQNVFFVAYFTFTRKHTHYIHTPASLGTIRECKFVLLLLLLLHTTLLRFFIPPKACVCVCTVMLLNQPKNAYLLQAKRELIKGNMLKNLPGFFQSPAIHLYAYSLTKNLFEFRTHFLCKRMRITTLYYVDDSLHFHL